MPRNIELKVPFKITTARRAALEQLGARLEANLVQVDTYFLCRDARLKLREVTEQAGVTTSHRAELIAYRRADDVGLRQSDYLVSAVPDVDAIKSTLTMALGVSVVVQKRRELLIWENVRIHLDQVEGLGSFLEFEAVLDPGSDANAEAESHQRLAALISALGINTAEAIAGSYADLLTRR